MGVRKTESRIPANFEASDLGEAATGSGCALISFITAPLVVTRENVYVVIVTDAGLAASTESFEWSFAENDGSPTLGTTAIGECAHQPQAVGALTVTVRLLGAGNTEQTTLTLTQDVVAANAELESLITAAGDEPGPGVANPETARELVNDHNPYYQSVTLQTPEGGEGFQKFVFSLVHDGVLQRPATQRREQLEQLAAALNGETSDFVTQAAVGAGVCSIRLALLAMTLPQAPGGSPLLSWTELPEAPDRRGLADEQLRQTLAALDESARIDLFNLVRFPKSNITQCGHILEALRDRYFTGTNFSDVLTGMSGTRAHWIMRHYREGPLVRD